ncbi:Uracil DNA glycosylase superfamily protein [Rubripirellula amarantea]|uniref:Uracil DNA glycosylase superfamily protein n=1 Tax=Rubripirellula amarantea TaxID=2527999 RepID=A0A5C5WH91_9BACT|nr:single-strand selective monofunctional uracil-DNA glycosylase [Rubripirellula amarantea]TWT49471.1 Uracil DNA glycosylase superfamily protein [Rubripirellula amarantea]
MATPSKRSGAQSARTALIKAAKKLRDRVDKLEFAEPVTHVYNPLRYAWKSHEAYLSMANDAGAKVLFLGMNPGPWGMAQTGVPFGEIAAVKDWLGIHESVKHPKNEHPKRIVEGFECQRSEVSGRRLWGLFQSKYEQPSDFFKRHFIANYCPLVFMESSARNRTPDKLPAAERELLDSACDAHLRAVIDALKPKHLVGVGAYAEKCLARVLEEASYDAHLSRILHPSPASPAANKDWSGQATKQLIHAGVW